MNVSPPRTAGSVPSATPSTVFRTPSSSTVSPVGKLSGGGGLSPPRYGSTTSTTTSPASTSALSPTRHASIATSHVASPSSSLPTRHASIGSAPTNYNSSSSTSSSSSSGLSPPRRASYVDGYGARGAGFGLDAELARKMDAKYDYTAERQVIQWIQAVTGESLAAGFSESLHSGQILCRLINRIKPGTITKIETSAMSFKEMENISHFLQACRSFGMADFDAFETLDLYESKV